MSIEEFLNSRIADMSEAFVPDFPSLETVLPELGIFGVGVIIYISICHPVHVWASIMQSPRYLFG